VSSRDRPDSTKRRASNYGRAVGGVGPNVAAALSYVLGPVSGILFLLLEKRNRYVRFHAAHCLAVSVLLIVLNVGLSLLSGVLAIIPVIGAPIVVVLRIGLALMTLVVWLLLMWKAYRGERWALPVAGEIARKMV
jgi:uncharacterized membrane protein